MVADDPFSNLICSICFEDLNPSVEYLQSISLCGHVFHELCLQQWFEYSAKSNLTCPVCKQRCESHNACHLYFQSTDDGADPVLSQSRSVLVGLEESPEVLRREVKKLELKVSVLKSTLDLRQGELKQTNEELHLCKEQLSNEVALKVEALKQKEKFQETLRTKSSELVKSSLECSGLREENLALAKELAALKQSYSDLMARSHAKVEKAKKEKISTLEDENPISAKRLKAHMEMYPTLSIEVFENFSGAHSRKVGF